MATRGRPRHPDILTPREWAVLELLRQRLTNEEIAEQLGITLDGAKYHVSSILSKLGVPSRQEAAAWTPEEARPWTAARWALAAGGVGVIVAAVGGLALLALGVLLSGDGGEGTVPAGGERPSAIAPSARSSGDVPPASVAATKACDSLLDPTSGVISVETSYESTAGLVLEWDDVPDLRSLPADEAVFVCLINGAFPKSPPNGGGAGSPPRSYDRALFLVRLGGEPSQIAVYGYAESLSWTDGPAPVIQ